MLAHSARLNAVATCDGVARLQQVEGSIPKKGEGGLQLQEKATLALSDVAIVMYL